MSYSTPYSFSAFHAIIRVLETFFTILSMCWLYDLTISNFGNPVAITATPWTLDACITLQGLVGAVVQSFFAFRVWRVSRTLLWSSLAWAGALSRVAFNLSMSYRASKAQSIIVFSDKYGWEVTTSLTIALAVDILNVAALTWYLSGMRTGFHRYVPSEGATWSTLTSFGSGNRTTRVIDSVIVFSIGMSMDAQRTYLFLITYRC